MMPSIYNTKPVHSISNPCDTADHHVKGLLPRTIVRSRDDSYGQCPIFAIWDPSSQVVNPKAAERSNLCSHFPPKSVITRCPFP